jgi:hypothetical protein
MFKVKQSQIHLIASDHYMDFDLTLFYDESYGAILLSAGTINNILKKYCIGDLTKYPPAPIEREMYPYYLCTYEIDESLNYIDGYFNYMVLRLIECNIKCCHEISDIFKFVNGMIDKYHHAESLTRYQCINDRIDS